MAKNLPLEKMSLEEKLQTMEEIWDDLVSHAESVESPDWHRTVLKEREQGVQNRTEEAVEWDSAKKKLKKEIE